MDYFVFTCAAVVSTIVVFAAVRYWRSFRSAAAARSKAILTSAAGTGTVAPAAPRRADDGLAPNAAALSVSDELLWRDQWGQPVEAQGSAHVPLSDRLRAQPWWLTSPTDPTRLEAPDRLFDAEWKHRPAVDLKAPLIFVSIPSYCDPELPHTVRTCFCNAANPSRVRVVALVQKDQSDPRPADDIEAVLRASQVPRSRIEEYQKLTLLQEIPKERAQGPCVARARIEAQILDMAGPNDFVLMVDSHTLFLRGWDEYLRKEHVACGSARAILSSYPGNYYRRNREKILRHNAGSQERHGTEDSLESGCFMSVGPLLPDEESGLPGYDSRPFARVPSRPARAVGWAACMSFGTAAAHRAARYVDWADVHFGEEPAMHARFHTAGYTVFHPRRMPMLTHFDRGYRPVFHAPPADPAARARWTSKRSEGASKVHSALGLGRDASRSCAVGSRSLESFYALWGVDPSLPSKVALSRAAGVLRPESTAELQDKYGSKKAAAKKLQALADLPWVDRTNRAATSADPFAFPASPAGRPAFAVGGSGTLATQTRPRTMLLAKDSRSHAGAPVVPGPASGSRVEAGSGGADDDDPFDF